MGEVIKEDYQPSAEPILFKPRINKSKHKPAMDAERRLKCSPSKGL